MRLATFNCENLFDRPKIMNLPNWSDGQAVLDDYKELTTLFQQSVYTGPEQDAHEGAHQEVQAPESTRHT